MKMHFGYKSENVVFFVINSVKKFFFSSFQHDFESVFFLNYSRKFEVARARLLNL